MNFTSYFISFLGIFRLFLGEITLFANGISIISSEIFCKLLEKLDSSSSFNKSTQFDLVRLCIGFNLFLNYLLNCRYLPSVSSIHIFYLLTLALWKYGDLLEFEFCFGILTFWRWGLRGLSLGENRVFGFGLRWVGDNAKRKGWMGFWVLIVRIWNTELL